MTSHPGDAQIHRDIAACYRLVALFGFADLTDGFVSARSASEPGVLICGPYGVLPELMTASRLCRAGIGAEPVLVKHGGVDVDAHYFTSTMLEARPDFQACLHAHPSAIVALSCLDVELQPIGQFGRYFHGHVGYLGFDGADVTKPSARKAIADQFASGKELLILRNHGVLIGGRTVAQLFHDLYRLEQACRLQIELMKTGARILVPSDDEAERHSAEYREQITVDNDGSREWESLLTRLDRIDPSYRD